MTAGGGLGDLAFVVWPSYIAFAANETDDVPQDRRAQIQWRVENGIVVGSARCWVPAGDHGCLLYFRDPVGPHCGAAPFDHPFRMPADDWVIVDPIENRDPINQDMAGVAR